MPQWLKSSLRARSAVRRLRFGEKALWSEAVDAEVSGEAALEARVDKPGIMETIKQMLADHMKVDPNKLEVDVRVKL